MAASSASASVPATTQHVKLHRFKCHAIRYLISICTACSSQLCKKKGCSNNMRLKVAEYRTTIKPVLSFGKRGSEHLSVFPALVDRTKMEPREHSNTSPLPSWSMQ
eukprot:scaffold976_cov102-Skeletonema_dohrnii-CCMP3373.AAC.13